MTFILLGVKKWYDEQSLFLIRFDANRRFAVTDEDLNSEPFSLKVKKPKTTSVTTARPYQTKFRVGPD